MSACPIEPLTYGEWRARGLQVVAGEKSIGRNAAGEAVFSINQVIEPINWESEDPSDWVDFGG